MHSFGGILIHNWSSSDYTRQQECVCVIESNNLWCVCVNGVITQLNSVVPLWFLYDSEDIKKCKTATHSQYLLTDHRKQTTTHKSDSATNECLYSM